MGELSSNVSVRPRAGEALFALTSAAVPVHTAGQRTQGAVVDQLVVCHIHQLYLEGLCQRRTVAPGAPSRRDGEKGRSHVQRARVLQQQVLADGCEVGADLLAVHPDMDVGAGLTVE